MSNFDSDKKNCSNVIGIIYKGGLIQRNRATEQTTSTENDWRRHTRPGRRNAPSAPNARVSSSSKRRQSKGVHSSPVPDLLKALLSFMAGLRACEISKLRIEDVTKADGSTANVFQIRPGTTKGGRGPEIPIIAQLKDAIDEFRLTYPASEWLALSHNYGTTRH